MSEEPSLFVLILSIVFLLILSAFFSGSETGMMASNKIKLRNKAKSGKKNSKRALELLAKPDNLLYIAIDGVAPRAKMEQQRTRRYRSQKGYCRTKIRENSRGKNFRT